MNQVFGTYDGTSAEIKNNNCNYGIDKEIELCFIGEVFNNHELQTSLYEYGFKFQTANITELLLTAYRAWGTKFPDRLIGRFSLAVYDPHKKIIFIARDPVGLKPLYYCSCNGKFAYSSEIKSLIDTSWIPKDIDLNALNYYFAYRFIPDEMTIYKYIRKVPAGSVLLYNLTDKSIQKWQYWEPPDHKQGNENENTILEKLENIVIDSLKIRINGNNPPGVFLSGGLDSSLMVALMGKYVSKPIKTFSVGFEIKKYNEIPYCRIISNHFNTDHHDIIVKPDFNDLMETINIFDEPFANPSIIPNYYAARVASGKVDSIITGDGADGLFLGLRTHLLSVQHSNRNNYIAAPFKKALHKIANIIPEEAKWKMFLQDLTPEEFFKVRSLVFSATLRKKLFKSWVQEELKDIFYEPENNIVESINSYKGTFIDKMGYATFKADADDSFFKTDRLGNKFSLNIRTPFLDKRLVEFAFKSVPSNMKIRGNITKYILKKFASGALPAQLPLGRKRGFNPPFSEWLRNEWWSLSRDIIMNGDNTFLDKEYMEKLLKYHKNGIFNVGRMIFSLLCFKIWENKYL
jgi:asparagine synthase (glutamine-hydrolysing)